MRLLFPSLILCGCARQASCTPEPERGNPDARGGNIVVVLIDDVGTDKLGAWEEHPEPARTPRIDALVASGVRFSQAFGQPVCSPARAALVTGRVAMRTGIGSTVRPDNDDFDLPKDEITLPEMLRSSPLGPWSSGMVGKWHLSTLDDAGARGPLDHGFDRFLGILENPNHAIRPDGLPLGYTHWEKSTDGVLSFVDDYLVTTQTDDALALMETLPEPWLLYVAYSGAHLPTHVPPTWLWSGTYDETPESTLDRMIEALDTELGRLVDAVDDHTTVVFAGDNGTEGFGVRPPALRDRAKDTLHEGGVRVPLAISGYAVDTPGGVSDAMVHLVDVFATVADIAGVDLGALDREIDGTSLLPWLEDPDREGRSCLVIDEFPYNGERDENLDRSIRDERYLLLRPNDGPDELYARFPEAPWEGDDLRLAPLDADANTAYRHLDRELGAAIRP